MRKPADLTHEQLLTVVNSVQQQLYLDVDSQGRFCWNPDKEWNGADVCEQLARLLLEQGMVPE